VGIGVSSDSSYDGKAFRLEQEVLSEKAKGLSDLEVALKLLLDERTVRSIFRRHMRRRKKARVHGPMLNGGGLSDREAGGHVLRWYLRFEPERPPQPPNPEPPKPPEPPPPSPPRPGPGPTREAHC
jgi:hypothetical protein